MPTEITATVDPTASRTDARTLHDQPVVMDADPPHGADAAASPIETLLAALAGCTAMDVASILRKKRQVASSYELVVSGSQRDEHPRVFTAIAVEHRLTGDLDPEAVRRSVELSATQYCPVNAMLSAVARIEHRYRLTGDDGVTHQAVVAIIGPDRRIQVL